MSDESDVVKGVRGWLEKQGFPLEMRVASAFESKGFAVEQSHYYVVGSDPPREMDVLAWRSLTDPRFVWQPASAPRSPVREDPTRQNMLAFDAFVLVECKSGPADRPWIVFSSRKGAASLNSILESYARTNLAWRSILRIGEMYPDRLPLFAPRDRYGHSLVTASLGAGQKERKADDGYDVAYSALKKIAEATESVIGEKLERITDRLFRLVVPIIVTSSPVVECWLQDGSLQIEERGDVPTRFVTPTNYGSQNVTLVHVVREASLNDFIDRILTTLNALADKLEIVWDELPLKQAGASDGSKAM